MAEPLIMHGDMLTILPMLEAESVDSCVTDPPYHLSMVKRFGNSTPGDVYRNAELRKNFNQGVSPHARAARGFMGKQWDGGDIAFRPETWAVVYRVLKPGAHLIAFGGTRTYHRMACAIEDAGFEIRDQIGWLYGSGFPKSHDVAVAIDKQNGVPPRSKAFNMKGRGDRADELDTNGREFLPKYEAVTDAARQWEGWGTALKPAWEPIVLARKPLIGTVAANVLAHGTGALNIDGCRVETDELTPRNNSNTTTILQKGFEGKPQRIEPSALGRWPANVIHDGSAEVLAAFPDSEGQQRATGPSFKPKAGTPVYGDYGERPDHQPRGDSGSAARFFYTAKADAGDRLGSKHPTVKPVDLMAYLCRLVTPPGGTVLDPFAGSGTTGMACMREGFDCILIEREAEYVEDIKRRLVHVRGEDKPLFAGVSA